MNFISHLLLPFHYESRKERPPLLPKPAFGEVKRYTFPDLFLEGFEKLKLFLMCKSEDASDEDSTNIMSDEEEIENKVIRINRTIYLIFSEPLSSVFSVVMFLILVFIIILTLLLMVASTHPSIEFTPSSCNYCNEFEVYDDAMENSVSCICPPETSPGVFKAQAFCLFYLTFELIVRILSYEPHPDTYSHHLELYQKVLSYAYNRLLYLLRFNVIIDFISILPLYLENAFAGRLQGLISLRFFHVFRICFLCHILGTHSLIVICLKNVLLKSVVSLKILFMFLGAGALLFGSMMYFAERGVWMYTDDTDPPSFMYMRKSLYGDSWEPSPYVDIFISCWWFIVTVTTVGYGDVYPTSTLGRIIATLAMIMGLLVIAFPVSIFSDLWTNELHKIKIGSNDDVEDINDHKSESSLLVESKKMSNIESNESKAELCTNEKEKQQTCNKSNSDELLQYLTLIDNSQKEIRSYIDTMNDVQMKVVYHFHKIDESQNKIRSILERNDILT